jgi:hypothetical protein
MVPVATLLSETWAALCAGDHAGVLARVEALPGGLSPGERGRAEAWRAQALRALGRVEEADRAVIAAIRAAKADGDVEGVRQLRELHASVVASLAAQRHAEAARAADAVLAETDDATLLAGANDEAARADALLRRANARTDAARMDDAAADLARAQAHAEASGDPRARVLVRLALARVAVARGADPGALVREAHVLADASDDMNLVTAVARAARAAGVVLVAPGFG